MMREIRIKWPSTASFTPWPTSSPFGRRGSKRRTAAATSVLVVKEMDPWAGVAKLWAARPGGGHAAHSTTIWLGGMGKKDSWAALKNLLACSLPHALGWLALYSSA